MFVLAQRVFEIPKQVTLVSRMRHLSRKKPWQNDHICQDRVVASFVIFACSIIISFKKWVFAEESLYLSIVISVY